MTLLRLAGSVLPAALVLASLATGGPVSRPDATTGYYSEESMKKA